MAGASSHAAKAATSGSDRRDEHGLAIARAFDGVADLAIDEREKRMVLTNADVRAGMKLGTTLANDDRTGRNLLAAEHLHAQHLGLGVAAVPCGTAALFLCPGFYSLTGLGRCQQRVQALTAPIWISVKFWR